MTARILIIAGSDSGGGAGVQADIKTVTLLGGHAMTAITAITAQNTLGVQAVHLVPTDMVLAQIDSVVNDIGVDAVKIGMIGSAETANAVAERLCSPPFVETKEIAAVSYPDQVKWETRERVTRVEKIPIVFDPVMVATSGSALADEATIAVFHRLMTLADVTTPNIPELKVLSGMSTVDAESRLSAARALVRASGKPLLLKGGHGRGRTIRDLLVWPGGSLSEWQGDRIDTDHSHGTGCTLASAIAAGLGESWPLEASIDRARRYVRAALEGAPGLGLGHGPMGVPLGFDADV
ncbi:MAG: bifunctional hydroxymethylpyrimidine kinase/phosphomethylpyrimidine kinase [Sphingobium sp.]|uniref:bifunctional hydroxymethylpyrimidine kinase/phosphomethylpyrimidine kinase n=1 Tax=Sphingobium sp. TaxID=1912891 RepID=UPI002E239B47